MGAEPDSRDGSLMTSNTESHGDEPPRFGRLDALIKERFSRLSPQLRQAARFVIDNPEEIALSSMRAAATKADVHPSTMLRLARQLGFESYDPFREQFRDRLMARSGTSWSGRADSLRKSQRGSAGAHVILELIQQEQNNLRDTFDLEFAEKLIKARDLILEARSLYILGLRSLFPVAFYFNYICRMFTNKTVLMTGTGGTFADELRNLEKIDALLAFSYLPYAMDTVKAVDFARGSGARIIAVTDSQVSPIADAGDVTLVVSTSTKSFFPTILPSFAVVQALAGLLISESGEETMAEITKSERQLESFGVYVGNRGHR